MQLRLKLKGVYFCIRGKVSIIELNGKCINMRIIRMCIDVGGVGGNSEARKEKEKETSLCSIRF